MNDHELASMLAAGAGSLLLEMRAQLAPLSLGERMDRGDAAAQEWISDHLRKHRPNDAVLSEEAPDNAARLSAERVWIIDPLDGTGQYGRGLDDWAVHIALWEGGELIAGAVDQPTRRRHHATPEVTLAAAAPGPLRIAVSRSRAPQVVREVAHTMGAELVPMGSAGVKAMSVVDGGVHAYVHAGGQYEWDSAAPIVVARQAGLYTSRIDGSPLRYNQPDPYLPDLVIARPEIAEELMAQLAALQ